MTTKFKNTQSGISQSQKHKYRQNESLTFDYLHQMTLIGHHVIHVLCVLFDNVHIYIKSQFTLARYVQ